MKKSDIKTGAIFEVPLAKNFGFGYVKIIFSKDIQPQYFDHLIVKAYNIYSKEKLNEISFNKEIFESDDLLLFPLLMMGLPYIKGEKKWFFKGYAELTEEDKIIPDFIHIMKQPPSYDFVEAKCSSENGCMIVRNFQNKRIQIKDYESIKHLGFWNLATPVALQNLLTMVWMKFNNVDILDFYKKSDFDKNFWLEYTYNFVMDNDLDFRNIRFDGRLKVK